MKLIFWLATVLAVSSATTLFTGKNIKVNDDGTIYITGEHGKKVTITRPTGYNGVKNIDITVTGPHAVPKHIQITDSNVLHESTDSEHGQWETTDEEYRPKRGSAYSGKRDKALYQGDILSEIFQQHAGVIDDATYDKLLKRINKAVLKGEINPTIYDLLQNFGSQDIMPYYPQYNGPYGQNYYYYPYGGNFYNPELGNGHSYFYYPVKGQEFYGKHGKYGYDNTANVKTGPQHQNTGYYYGVHNYEKIQPFYYYNYYQGLDDTTSTLYNKQYNPFFRYFGPNYYYNKNFQYTTPLVGGDVYSQYGRMFPQEKQMQEVNDVVMEVPTTKFYNKGYGFNGFYPTGQMEMRVPQVVY